MAEMRADVSVERATLFLYEPHFEHGSKEQTGTNPTQRSGTHTFRRGPDLAQARSAWAQTRCEKLQHEPA